MKHFKYELRSQRPLSREGFAVRLLSHFALAGAVIVVSLMVGMWGYTHFEQLSLTDAFLNSAMLLGGMGPVNNPITHAGKLFAGGYALFAGLIFLVLAGIMVGPVAHRVLHLFHWDSQV
jgi:hypothetical protein